MENELIDNDKDIIKVLNNNKKNEEKEEKIIFKQDTINFKKNNFLDIEKNENEKSDKNNGNNNNIEQNKFIIKENNQLEGLIQISQENKNNNDGSINKEDVSEYKNFMPLIKTSIIKKNDLGSENKEKIITKKIKTKPITIIKKQNINNIVNQNLISSHRNLKINEINNSYYRVTQFIQKNCFICEKPFYLTRLFCADCGKHFLCRKCVKNYYEDAIENKKNIRILKCPSVTCEKSISYEILEKIISEDHQQIYKEEISEKNFPNKNSLIYNSIKLGSKKDENNVKRYSEKHVLDISSNMSFFMFKKSKDIFCPKCLSPNLFSKTNNYFIKCLNCNLKICKFCLKEYTLKHMDIKVEGYCKVYFRRGDEMLEENKKILIYLLQLFFVIVMYLFTYCGTYLFFYEMLKAKFGLNGKRKNFCYYIKTFSLILLSSICLIICCPIIIISCPFFPAIIALCDY